MNILVVDDSDVMREALRRMGEIKKFTCTAAKTKGTWVEIGKQIAAADYMHENK